VFVVSGATGVLLHNLVMPDGRETYSLPAVWPGQPLELVFGSGGETLGGHLYRYALPDAGVWSVESQTKGFIASPALYDFDGKGVCDVIESSFDGTLMRVDGASGAVVWKVPRVGHEGYASPGLGRFGGQGSMDAVASFMRGTFPVYTLENVVVWVDGATGAVLDERKQGVFTSASPVVVDVDGDGFDETFVMAMDSFEVWQGRVRSSLVAYDGRPGRAMRLTLKLQGAGAATPVIHDLDGDGKLDLVFAYYGKLERHSLEVPGAGAPVLRWPGFRGPGLDGVLRAPVSASSGASKPTGR
jgi:hypothetical protein